MAAALIFAGCGSSGGGSSVDAWVGNWMEGGTQSTTCAGASTTTQLSMLVVFSAGTKAGTIESSADNCVLVWDVSGDQATLESGQTCTATIDGVNATVTWTASTLTLDGNTMTGTLGGSGNDCPFTQQATLTKM